MGVPLKSRNIFPPGGFSFYQPETGWSSTPHIGFDPTVTEIINHRKANPRFNLPTDKETVEIELENYTMARLAAMPGGEAYIIGAPGAPPPPRLPPRHRPASVAGAAEWVKNTVAGIGLWAEWFGDSPVSTPLAQRRASICVSCPKHGTQNVFQHFNEAAAKEISAIFGALKQRSLHTTYDDRLQVCTACDCPMRAKVWVPRDLILKHIRPEAQEKLWENCWIRQSDG